MGAKSITDSSRIKISVLSYLFWHQSNVSMGYSIDFVHGVDVIMVSALSASQYKR